MSYTMFKPDEVYLLKNNKIATVVNVFSYSVDLLIDGKVVIFSLASGVNKIENYQHPNYGPDYAIVGTIDLKEFPEYRL